MSEPSYDGYYPEIVITLIDPSGNIVKTVVMDLSEEMPDMAGWRNAAFQYRFDIEYRMRAKP